MVRIPDREEVWETLKRMSSDKAPGPDGLTVFFFKQYWEVVGNDVVSSVQGFFQRGILLPDLNHTNLVLILKVDNPFYGGSVLAKKFVQCCIQTYL